MTISLSPDGNVSDETYHEFVQMMQVRFNRLSKDQPVFSTDIGPSLFDIYLKALPAGERGYCKCNTCKTFMQRYGHLVVIDDKGLQDSVFWADEDSLGLYVPAAKAMRRAVRKARVTGVFLAKEQVWGTPKTGKWSHYAVTVDRPFKDRVHTPEQVMAEKKQDYETLRRALAEWDRKTLALAISVLDTDTYRGEKALGMVQWLLKVHDDVTSVRQANGKNLVWKAVATAPVGFCSPRSSVAGSLLDDLAAGKGIDAARRAFEAKMHPLRYQRPQAPPTMGNVRRAEKLVETLGIERSLERRFAHMDELPFLDWRPASDTLPTTGVFSHLTPQEKTHHDTKIEVMTFEKFRRTVMPKARSIHLRVPATGNFLALVTATHPDAPPILQWDHDNRRNPFSWYLYTGGSYAQNWGLRGGQMKPLVGITRTPDRWYETRSNFPDQFVLLMDGMWDKRNMLLGLFPEILKSDLHEVRSTIEAHNRSRAISGGGRPHAAGYLVSARDTRINIELEVHTDRLIKTYKIDRWD